MRYTVQSARLLGLFRNENFENPRRLNRVSLKLPFLVSLKKHPKAWHNGNVGIPYGL